MVPLRHSRRSRVIYPQAVAAVIDLFHPSGGIVEIRSFKTRRGTLSGYFDNTFDLTHAIERWNGQASIYMTINQLKSALLARARNHLIAYASMTTSAEDVLRRTWFPVDYDPARPRGIPATDAEVAAALQRRDAVIAYLRDAGWPEPLGLLSGNGTWTLFRVDLPNTEEVSRLFQQALGALSARFSDKIVTIDRAVYQPAQLIKLCGTIAVTGDEIPGRPHRRVEIQPPIPLHLIDPGTAELVSLEQLRWLAGQKTSSRSYSLPSRARGVDLGDLFRRQDLYLRPLDGDA